MNTGNGFGAAFGGVAEASGERNSFSELRDNFTKRRTEDKRQTIALGDYLDGDPRKREMDKSPVIVAADLARRKTTSKLGDWLDSPSNKTKVKTGGEAKESEGKTNWLKAKSKILAKVRDDASPGADGSKITRTSTFAGVAKDVVEKQRKMSASAVAAPPESESTRRGEPLLAEACIVSSVFGPPCTTSSTRGTPLLVAYRPSRRDLVSIS